MRTRTAANLRTVGTFTLRVGLGSLLLAILFGSWAMAGPQGETVVNGNVQFHRDGATTTIQASNGAIINYTSFDIHTNETVQFVQPSATSRVLNRIQSVAPTNIDGTLRANGIVYIVNPSGVIFGQGAVLDVAGIYAAAASISNQDFINGLNHFTDAAGNVENYGTITGSAVNLIGKHVANHGSIIAPAGMVTMAAGEDILLGEFGGHVMVKVEGSGEAAEGAQAPAETPGVENTGSIEAPGGKVLLGAGDVYSIAARHSGRIQAKDVTIEGAAGKTQVSGSIDTSGATGGDVKVLGEKVELTGADIDASGEAGGGKILVGGDYQGRNPDVRNAARTYVDAETALRADATAAGDGGTIVVWADDLTVFGGSASVRGAGGGDGGLIETSGKNMLFVTGSATIDLAAPGGSAGEWLLDPANVTLSDAATANMAGDPDWAPTDSSATGNVQISAIETVLNGAGGGTVTVTTTNDGASGGEVGTLTVSDPIDVDLSDAGATTSTLTLTADDLIDISNTVTLTTTDDPGDTFNLNLNATAGVDINAAISNTSGSGLINLGTTGTTFDNTGGAITTTGGTVSILNSGAITIGAAVATAGADIAITGSTVDVNNTLNAGAGTVRINATSTVGQTAAITAAALGIVADDAITLTNTGNAVGTFAADTASGGAGAVSYTDSDSLIVGAVADSGGVLGAALNGIDSGGTTAITLDGAGATLQIATGNPVTSTSGTATLTADKMDIDAAITATGQVVVLKPNTAADAIDLGSATDAQANTLELSDTELDNVTATTLRIGATDAGAISVTAALTPGSISNLSLLSDEGVDDGGDAGTIVLAGGLRIDVDTAVDLDQANDIDTLAVATSGTGAVGFTDSDGFAVGSVDTTLGIVTGDGAVTLTPGGQLDVDQAINTSAAAGHDIVVTGDNAVVISGVNLTTDTGAINLNSSAVTLDTGAVQISTGAGAGNITIDGTIQSATNQDLTINAGAGGGGGDVSLGAVGLSGSNEIGNLAVTGGSTTITLNGDVYTTGTQDYNSAVVIATDVTLDAADAAITFDGAVSGTSADSLIVDAGTSTVTFSGAVGAGGQIAGLTVTGDAGISVASDITTTGAQDYNDAVTITDNVTFDADNANITFDLAVGGTSADNLTVDAGTETITFSGAVGGGSQINNIDLTAGTLTQDGVLTAQGTFAAVVTNSLTIDENITSGGTTDITVTGDGATLEITTGDTVSSTSGTATLTADRMDLAGAVDATGQVVVLKANAAGDAIDVGSATDAAADTLELSDTELDSITATTLRIGATDAGAISVTAALTPGSISNLSLLSDEGVGDAGDTGSIVLAGGLRIDVDSVVDLSVATNDVDTLAVAIADPASGLTFNDADGLTVGTVDGTTGVNVTGATLIALGGDDAVLTIAGGATVTTTAGGLTLQADEMDLSGTAVAAGQSVTLRPNEADAIELGTATGTGEVLELTDAELDNVTASTLVVGSDTSGAITVIDAVTPDNITTLLLQSEEGVGDNGDAGSIVVTNLAIDVDTAVDLSSATNNVDVLAATVADAGEAFTYADADTLEVGSVGTLDGVTTNEGDITISSANTMTLSQLIDAGGTTADVYLDTTTDGDILDGTATPTDLNVRADVLDAGTTAGVANGDFGASGNRIETEVNTLALDDIAGDTFMSSATPIEVAPDPVSGEVDGDYAVTGTATITITDPAGTPGIVLTDGTSLTSVDGDIILNAAGEAVTMNNTTIQTDGGNVDFDVASFSMTNGSIESGASGGDGQVQITTATGDISLTGGTITESGTGAIVLDSAGNVTDGDATARLIGSDLTIDAGTGIGTSAANPLNMQVTNLAVRNDTSGEIYISNTGALVIGGNGLLVGGNGVTDTDGTDGFIQASSPLTISADATHNGTFTYTASDDNGSAGDAITINNNATITLDAAGDSTLTFQAGDDFEMTNGTVQTQGGGTHTVAIWADHEADGADGDRGGVNQAAGTITTNVLAVSSYEDVNLTQATNDADTVAAVVNNNGADFNFQDADGVEIGSGTIPTLGGATDGITTASGTVRIGAGGTVTQTAAGTVTGLALGIAASDTITLDQANDVDTLAAQVTTATSGLRFDDADDLTVGSVADSASPVFGADLDGVTTNDGDFCLQVGGALSVNQAVGVGTGIVRINAGGTVDQLAAITGGSLAVVASDAITLANVGNDVNNFAADTETGGVGAVSFADADGFAVATVADSAGACLGGDIDGIQSADAVTLVAVTGGLVVNDTADAADIDAAGALNVTLSGDDTIFQITAGAAVDVAAGGATVSADKMDLDGTLTATGQTVALMSTQAGDAIDLGSATDAVADTLELAEAELDNITADTLRIGDTDAGAISLTAAIGPDSVTTLSLLSDEGVGDAGDTGSIAVTNLRLDVDTAVDLSVATNDVDTLALAVADAAEGAYVRDADDLTVDTVDTTVGVTTNAGDLCLRTGGALAIDQAVDVGAGTVRLNSGDTITQTATITGASLGLVSVNAVTLDQANDVDTLSAEVATAGQGMRFDDVDDVTIGAVADSAVACLDQDLTGVTVNDADVCFQVGDAFVVGQAVNAGAGTVRINAGDVVGQTAEIVADTLGVLAGGAITLTNANNDVNTFAADTETGGIGGVSFTDADGFTVGNVADSAGVCFGADLAGIQSAGTVDLTSTVGGITVANTADADDIDAGAATTVTLNGDEDTFQVAAGADVDVAAGGATVEADKIDIAGTLTATGQTVALMPSEAGEAIDVGSGTDAAADTLEISDTELDAIDATTVRIGDTDAGAISITAALTPATATTLALLSDEGVSDGGVGTIAVNDLRVDVDTAVDLSLGHTVSNLAMNVADATENARFTSTGALTVNTVDGTVGVTVNGGDLNLESAATLDFQQAADAGTGTIRLETAGAITQAAAGTITAGALGIESGGAVTLTQDNDADNLAATVGGGNGFAYQDVDDVTVTTVAAGQSFAADVDGITTVGADICLRPDGTLAIQQPIAAGVGIVRINEATGGGTVDVTQTAAGTITAAELAVVVPGQSVALNTADNDVDTLAGQAADFAFNDVDTYALGNVSDGAFCVGFNGLDVTNICLSGTDVTVDSAINTTGTVRINSTGTVTQTQTITASELGIYATDTVTLELANDVDTLAAEVTGSGSGFRFNDIDDVTVDTVTQGACLPNDVTGITTNDGDVCIETATTLDFQQAVAAGAGVVRLDVPGAITQAAAGTITAGSLGIDSDAAVTLDQANDVDTLAADLSGGAGGFQFNDADGFTVGSVTAGGCLAGDVDGVTTAGQDICLQAGTTLHISQAVNAGAAVVRLLTGGSITQAATGPITAVSLGVDSDGTATLDQGNDVDTLAADLTGGTGGFQFNDTDDVVVNSVTAGGCFAGQVDGIATTDADVCLQTGTTLDFQQAVAAGAGTIRLAATGAVTQAAAGTLTGGALGIDSDAAVTLGQGNDVDTLAADLTGGVGGMFFNDVDGFAVGTVTAAGCLAGDVTGLSTTDADVCLIGGGALAVDQAVNVGVATLRMNASGTVTQSAEIVAAVLGIVAADAITLTNTSNDVGTFAADTEIGGTGGVSFTDADGFTVGTVADSVGGCLGVDLEGIQSADTVTLNSVTGDVIVADTGNADDIDAAGAVSITLDGDEAVFQIAGGADVDVAAGGAVLSADKMDLAGTVTATGQTVALMPTEAGEAIDLGSAADAAADTLELAEAELDNITADTLRIGDTDAGAISLTAAIGPDSVTTLSLLSDEGVDDAGDTGSVVVTNLRIDVDTAVDLSVATNDVDALAIAIADTGEGAYVQDADDLTVDTVDGVVGVATNDGDICLISGTTMTLNQSVDAGTETARLNSGGNLTQLATGAIAAGSLGIVGGADVILDEPTNDVDTLAADVTGAFRFIDNDGYTVGSVADSAGACLGADLAGLTAGGDIEILTDLTLDDPTTVVPTPRPVGDYRPAAVILIDDVDIASTGGDVYLNVLAANVDVNLLPTTFREDPANPGQPAIPSVATIGTTFGTTAVTISGTNVVMGGLEKISSYGDLTIQATGTATVGDLNAADTVEVDATTVQYLLREQGFVLGGDEASLTLDSGLDFNGTRVDFNTGTTTTNRLVGGSNGDAGFGAWGPYTGADVLARPVASYTASTDFAYTSLLRGSAVVLGDGDPVLDEYAQEGVVVSNLASALASALPEEEIDVTLDRGVPASQREDLVRHLGIYTKDANDAEEIEWLSGRRFFNDLPEVAHVVTAGDMPGGATSPSQHKVSIDRLPGSLAREALVAYRALYWREKVDPETGEKIWESRASEIRSTLQKAVNDYKKTEGKKEFDAAGFGRWLACAAKHPEAHDLMTRLSSLFHRVELLGLGPVELEISQRMLARSIKPRGVTIDQMIEAVLSTPPTCPDMAPKPVSDTDEEVAAAQTK